MTKIEPLRESSHNNSSKTNNILYVLGGSQKSLERKFKTVASLYKNGSCKKIFLLSQPGNTEYDPLLSRNLTNDEWAIRELVNLRVKKEDIEFVSMERGLGGTLREAKAVSDLVLKRGHKRFILVSSSYHTKRVWVTFSKFLMNNSVIINIYSSNEGANLWVLLLEYLKLTSYQYIILQFV